ncbi:sigma-54 interaction domain-containing protein [Psychrosphaera aestuarii]|uniref:sigma-54 interaction domain-containing protein n=1 Tax=Psychrosphaera aestuarii TaxID=1266052 RepID=UPI001FD53C05|nr:sigma-54-dependent Fis family transcriptional regulator [Psychrosphaera aestuarii]
MNISIVQSMINAIEKPAIFISTEYVIKAVNQRYVDAYKKPVNVGTSRCYEVSHSSSKPCDQNGESCPIQECIQTEKATSVVHIHQMPTGKEFCDIIMRPVKDEDGITIGFLEILENIRYAASSPKKNKMLGKSDLFLSMLKHINRAAKSNISVLLQGQTGTGKELVAKALHESSTRNEQPFEVIECSGLPESLFESELFGHEKGAFTGAVQSKKGLVELADGGTVFFDEIADVPLAMQVKLLRLIETQTYRSVGGTKVKTVNLRFIAASHKNLLELVRKGMFREDLYYRIAGFPIQLPTLKQRSEDIELLASQFLIDAKYDDKHLSDEALTALKNYDFPGNIRELKNIVSQAALMADNAAILASDLPLHVTQNEHTQLSGQVPTNKPAPTVQQIMTLEELEASYLETLLTTNTLSFDDLAASLKISPRTLYRKLKKYNIANTLPF